VTHYDIETAERRAAARAAERERQCDAARERLEHPEYVAREEAARFNAVRSTVETRLANIATLVEELRDILATGSTVPQTRSLLERLAYTERELAVAVEGAAESAGLVAEG
jgi:hypothetical protein